jgi:hypothetical protein
MSEHPAATEESVAPALPTYEDARGRVHKGGASDLDRFVYVFTPKDREGEEEFRAALASLFAAAEAGGAERERALCIEDAEGERLSGETGEESDEAYNTAIEHVVNAICARAGKD